eukprot:jgi/Mesvir1/13910/Mv16033-RA.2
MYDTAFWDAILQQAERAEERCPQAEDAHPKAATAPSCDAEELRERIARNKAEALQRLAASTARKAAAAATAAGPGSTPTSSPAGMFAWHPSPQSGSTAGVITAALAARPVASVTPAATAASTNVTSAATAAGKAVKLLEMGPSGRAAEQPGVAAATMAISSPVLAPRERPGYPSPLLHGGSGTASTAFVARERGDAPSVVSTSKKSSLEGCHSRTVLGTPHIDATPHVTQSTCELINATPPSYPNRMGEVVFGQVRPTVDATDHCAYADASMHSEMLARDPHAGGRPLIAGPFADSGTCTPILALNAQMGTHTEMLALNVDSGARTRLLALNADTATGTPTSAPSRGARSSPAVGTTCSGTRTGPAGPLDQGSCSLAAPSGGNASISASPDRHIHGGPSLLETERSAQLPEMESGAPSVETERPLWWSMGDSGPDARHSSWQGAVAAGREGNVGGSPWQDAAYREVMGPGGSLWSDDPPLTEATGVAVINGRADDGTRRASPPATYIISAPSPTIPPRTVSGISAVGGGAKDGVTRTRTPPTSANTTGHFLDRSPRLGHSVSRDGIAGAIADTRAVCSGVAGASSRSGSGADAGSGARIIAGVRGATKSGTSGGRIAGGGSGAVAAGGSEPTGIAGAGGICIPGDIAGKGTPRTANYVVDGHTKAGVERPNHLVALQSCRVDVAGAATCHSVDAPGVGPTVPALGNAAAEVAAVTILADVTGNPAVLGTHNPAGMGSMARAGDSAGAVESAGPGNASGTARIGETFQAAGTGASTHETPQAAGTDTSSGMASTAERALFAGDGMSGAWVGDVMAGEAAPVQDAGGQVAGSRKVTPAGARQKFDFFVIVDFEATCDASKAFAPQEIIEFPAVLLDARSLEVVSHFQRYVRPTEHRVLTAFCRQLTGITQEQVDGGVPLLTALLDHHTWLVSHGLMPDDPEQLAHARTPAPREGARSFLPDALAASRAQPTPVTLSAFSGGDGGPPRPPAVTWPKFAVVTWTDWDCKIMLEMECKWRRIRKPAYFDRWVDLKDVFKSTVGESCALKQVRL